MLLSCNVLTSTSHTCVMPLYTSLRCVRRWIKTVIYLLFIYLPQYCALCFKQSPAFSVRQHVVSLVHCRPMLSPVHRSHGWISKKRLKLWLWNFHHTVAPPPSFAE